MAATTDWYARYIPAKITQQQLSTVAVSPARAPPIHTVDLTSPQHDSEPI
jgi:hypothetical protein